MHMTVLVVSDAHIFRTPDGKFWCNTAMHGYEFWKRYLLAFEEVKVIARVKEVRFEEDMNKYIRADGENVTVFPLPFVRGIKGYAFNYYKIKKYCKKAARIGDCAVFRIPSIPAYLTLKEYRKRKEPYAVEVVIDPEDEYKNIPLLKKISVKILKKVCLDANGVSYVTKYYLQEKYKSGYKTGKVDKYYFEGYYSSIDLDKSFYYLRRKYILENKNKIKLLHIANSINNRNKGHEEVIKIAKILETKGIYAEVVFVGDGDLIDDLKKQTVDLNIEDRIKFVGYVSDKLRIKKYLLDADLFLFPSKAEGLPRVLIEAMATGLPCLASNVDGIPELLDKKYLFSPEDVTGFANKIEEIMQDESEMEYMGQINYKKALEYESTKLTNRRQKFYMELKNTAKLSNKRA